MSEELKKLQIPSEDKQREHDLQRHRKELKMLRRGSNSWAEIKILSYLDVFKNTREDDLTAYAVEALNLPASYIRQTFERMVEEKKIKHIVHNKIEPQKIYYEGSHLGAGIDDYSLWLLYGIDAMGDLEKYRKAIECELIKARNIKP